MRIIAPFYLHEPLAVQYTGSVNGITVIQPGSYFPCIGPVEIEGITYLNLLETIKTNLSASSLTNEFLQYDFVQGRFCSVTGSTEILRFFSGSSTPTLQNILGLTGSSVTGMWSSDFTPMFQWYSQERCITDYSKVFDQDVPYRSSEAEDGQTFALSAKGNSNFLEAKFTFKNEFQWKCHSYRSSSTLPYPLETHYKHVRSYLPFTVFSEVNTTNFHSIRTGSYNDRWATVKFTGRDAYFSPTPTVEGLYTHWNQIFNVRMLSRGEDFDENLLRLIAEPSIFGIVGHGNTLTANPGIWANAISVSGQWYTEDGPIAGATGLTYVVNRDDAPSGTIGPQIYYQEVASNINTVMSGTSNNLVYTFPDDLIADFDTRYHVMSGSVSASVDNQLISSWNSVKPSIVSTQLTSSQMPKYVESYGPSGYPGIFFEPGTFQVLRVSSLPISEPVIFAVGSWSSSSMNQMAYFQDGFAGGYGLIVRNNGDWEFYAGGQGADQSGGSPETIYTVMGGRRSSTNVQHLGVETTFVSASYAQGFLMLQMLIGKGFPSTSTNNNTLAGVMQRLVIFPNDYLDNINKRNDVVAYLRWTYKTPVSAPLPW